MDMTRSLTERLVAVRACTVQKIAIPLALLVFIAAPTVLLHWDFWLPAQAGRDELTVDQVEVALPVDQLLSLRYDIVIIKTVWLRQGVTQGLKLCCISALAQSVYTLASTQVHTAHLGPQ